MRPRNGWRGLFYEISIILLLTACRPPSVSTDAAKRDTLYYYFFSAPSSPAEALSRERHRIATKLLPYVYRIEVSARYRYRTDKYTGTGWSWGGPYVCTCRHLLPADADLRIELWDKNGSCYDAKLVWADKRSDVAFLWVASLSQEGLPLREDSFPALGETIYTVGAPLGLLGTLQEGFVSAELRYLEESAQEPFLQLSLPAQAGSSGSPVVDHQGRLIGMLSDIATYTAAYEGISFAVPTQVIQRVWRNYRSFASDDTQRTRSGGER